MLLSKAMVACPARSHTPATAYTGRLSEKVYRRHWRTIKNAKHRDNAREPKYLFPSQLSNRRLVEEFDYLSLSTKHCSEDIHLKLSDQEHREMWPECISQPRPVEYTNHTPPCNFPTIEWAMDDPDSISQGHESWHSYNDISMNDINGGPGELTFLHNENHHHKGILVRSLAFWKGLSELTDSNDVPCYKPGACQCTST